LLGLFTSNWDISMYGSVTVLFLLFTTETALYSCFMLDARHILTNARRFASGWGGHFVLECRNIFSCDAIYETKKYNDHRQVFLLMQWTVWFGILI
jgi:hypothetical protein